jgi:hypothetical protein
MKTSIALFILLLFISIAKGQSFYPIAITKSGMIPGKIKKTIETSNSIPVPITAETARSITALNVLAVNKDYSISLATVSSFQLTILEATDSSTMQSDGENFSKEMFDRITKVKSGAKIYFEGIKILFSDGVFGRLLFCRLK